MCYTVCLCWLSTLNINIAVCTCPSQSSLTIPSPHPSPYPPTTISDLFEVGFSSFLDPDIGVGLLDHMVILFLGF